MELNSLLSSITAVTTGSPLNISLDPNRYPFCKLIVSSASSLQGKVSLAYDHGSTFVNRPCVDTNGIQYAADATITLTTGADLIVETGGATDIKFTPSSGTGYLVLAKLNSAPGIDVGTGSYNTLTNTSSSTVSGSSATKLITNSSSRRAVIVHNCSSVYDLWIQLVATGASAPTISTSNRAFVIGVGASLVLPIGSGLDIYGLNSSGAATTSNYFLSEVA